jgi:beta-lactamase regulating signal transducer with metallopeptidase domain
MNLIDVLNQFSDWWWSHLVSAFWQAGVVGAALLVLVLTLGKRWPAPLRYALLVLALLKFAFPPWLPVPTGVLSHVAPAGLIHSRVPNAGSGQTTIPLPGRPGVDAMAAVSWKAWLLLCQGLGAGMFGTALIWQVLKFRRLTNRSELLRLDEETHDFYRDLAVGLGLWRIPPVLISSEVEGPMTCGLRRPRILLPESLVDRFRPEELRAVLAHELAHCHRGDLWLNHLQLALLTLWWFHPVLWLVNRALREIREDCCDDLLLARGIAHNDDYCEVLLRAAAIGAHRFAAPVFLRGGIHPLGRRLARITDGSMRRCEAVSWFGAAAVLLVAALLWPGIRQVPTPRPAARNSGSAEGAAFSAVRPVKPQPSPKEVSQPPVPAPIQHSPPPILAAPSVPATQPATTEPPARAEMPAGFAAQPPDEETAPAPEEKDPQSGISVSVVPPQTYPNGNWNAQVQAAQAQAALYRQHQYYQHQAWLQHQIRSSYIAQHRFISPPVRQIQPAAAPQPRPVPRAYVPAPAGSPWGIASQNIQAR